MSNKFKATAKLMRTTNKQVIKQLMKTPDAN